MLTGSLVNALAIILGSFVGFLLHSRLPQKIQLIVFQGLGLSTLLVGIQMALEVQDILVLIFSVVIGGVVGELAGLEQRLEKAGDFFKKRLPAKQDRFTEGFVVASILFCVGAMAVIGSLESGLKNDHSVLFTKSVIDGFAAVVLASTYGLGVLFSFVPILIYQGSITCLARELRGLISPLMINQLSAVGGLLIMGIGINLLEIKKIRLANLLPSLIVVILLTLLAGLFRT